MYIYRQGTRSEVAAKYPISIGGLCGRSMFTTKYPFFPRTCPNVTKKENGWRQRCEKGFPLYGGGLARLYDKNYIFNLGKPVSV